LVPEGEVEAHPHGIAPDAWPVLRRILDEDDIQTICEHDLQVVPFKLVAYQLGEALVASNFDSLERLSEVSVTQ
jgi:hypothetical protein